MGLAELCEVVLHPKSGKEWEDANKAAFEALFGAPGGRYPDAARHKVWPRAPGAKGVDAEDFGRGKSPEFVSFAAYTEHGEPKSGAYGGMSIAIFPPAEGNGPCLITMVVGTNGLAPDEYILGGAGHSRKFKAICAWLNAEVGHGTQVAWAKQDPTRVDDKLPTGVRDAFPKHSPAIDRYGRWMYAAFCPTGDASETKRALAAFLDVMFEERGIAPLTSEKKNADEIREKWLQFMMPTVTKDYVKKLLQTRKYVVLQGPPGTGKTRLAGQILREDYQGRGMSVQFHPSTTYESFVGGLAPVATSDSLGLRFEPTCGTLMRAAEEARKDSRPYLLHVDEINRADLSKVLGEAIMLLEPHSVDQRKVIMAHDFGKPFGREFSLPENLHIVGTMNSADRSIAILDIAVRRRFAFVSMWPEMAVVQECGCQMMIDAYRRLVDIFIESANEESFGMVPGHSYFLETDESKAPMSLKTNLKPLLEEYLAQGYVSGFAESIRAYIQYLNSL